MGTLVNYFNFQTSVLDDPRVLQLMSMWGHKTKERWPVGVIWFASYLVFLGTAYGTKATYLSAITSFNTIFGLLKVDTPFKRTTYHPPTQVDIFMALAFMASYKAASSCRGAKCAAEDALLLLGNKGPIIDPVLWKRMFRGIEVYKGRSYAEKIAVLPTQVRKKIEYMVKHREHLTITGASIILAELCGVLLGVRRSEHFASKESKPNKTTLLCFRNLAGATWDLADLTKTHNIVIWAKSLRHDDIIKVRLCYTKHQRHRVAHEVIAGPGYKLMSFVKWLKIIVRLRISRGERLSVNSPLLVRTKGKKIVPLTGAYMTSMDKIFGPVLGWHNATIHSRRRGFATAAAQNGIHMSYITIAMRHSQGVTMQYIALGMADKASITTRLAIASYNERLKRASMK